MKALIVDDEPKAQRILTHYLNEFCPGIDIVATANNVPSAVKAINSHAPNLIFLDIDMPQQNGFALFNYFETVNFQVIFVTASRDHAIEAFKVSALDYILKPIEIEQLIKAVEKAKNNQAGQIKEQIELFDQTTNPQELPKRIAISLNGRIEFIKVSDIVFMKAEGSYTEFFLNDERKLLSSKPLGEYEILEKHPHFLKTHRSYLINLQKVQSFEKDSGGYILMQGNHSVNLSRYKKEEFLQRMSQI